MVLKRKGFPVAGDPFSFVCDSLRSGVGKDLAVAEGDL